jgi:diol dehydratase reactivase alpha subunit
MAYIAGVDVGNNTTEVAIGQLSGNRQVRFLSSSMVRTIGIKGTLSNAMGIIDALDQALKPLGIQRKDLGVVLLNEATPVIGDIAMETITETIITESAMIGHNPSTPGGQGLGLGQTIGIAQLETVPVDDTGWVVIIPGTSEFESASAGLNRALSRGLKITHRGRSDIH